MLWNKLFFNDAHNLRWLFKSLSPTVTCINITKYTVMKKIGLIGDPHSFAATVVEAITVLQEHHADEIWCAGDIAGYGEDLGQLVTLLKKNHCHAIKGNHENWYLEKYKDNHDPETYDYLLSLPYVKEEIIEQKKVYMVHGSPPDSVMQGIRLLDQSGNLIESERLIWQQSLSKYDFDVLIVGHTHQVFAEQLGNILVINPGSCHFNRCCGILTLPQLTVDWYPLAGKSVRKSWNWGMNMSESGV